MLKIIRNVAIIVLLLLPIHLYFYKSEHIKRIDYAFYDFISMLSTKINGHSDSFYSVIVDIDEKSLHQLGQWPWPRVIDAKLIDMIDKMNPSAIGVNILFPEKDRVSPISIQKFYRSFFDLNVEFSQFPEELKDNDKLLFNTIKKSNATLAIYFYNSLYTATHCQKLSYMQNRFSNMQSDFRATSLLCNHKNIQDGVKNFGFINASIDSDGIFRRVPIFMNYNSKIFPSFALATLLSFDKYIKIDKIPSTILVKFPPKKPKIFSAVDILDGKISPYEIQGKIVIIGSSVVGLNPTYLISNGKKISNSMIHASLIDNILSDTTLTQPKIYKRINIFLSLFLSLFIMFLLFRRLYIYVVILLFATLLITLLWLIDSYSNGIYISIGYLWTPIFYFFISVLIYHIRVINQERQQQETLLIRHSKLASMGKMISLIAHQWRQPLSVINGIVLSLDMDNRKKILDTQRLDSHLNRIEDTTAYLSDTINDFTDFFSENKTKESFYIIDVIKQVKQLLNSIDQKDIEIVYIDKDIEIVGYKSELIQSLLIILNNAIYACRENLKNRICGKITIQSYTIKETLFISIEDNGGGVKTKNFKKIFDPYFTTKDKPHGTGLGLYILKLIIEDSMGGRVSLKNGKEGAIFTIEIPKSF